MMTKLPLFLFFAACTSSSGSTSISSQPLAGKIGGTAWTFVAGATNKFLSEGHTDFFAELYPATYTACSGSGPTGNHAIVAIPKQTGDYEMNLQRNMTFVVGASNNLIATQGRIRVDTVTADKVTGGLHGIYDGSNEIDGTFTLTVCTQ
jgi:hypothetical protein